MLRMKQTRGFKHRKWTPRASRWTRMKAFPQYNVKAVIVTSADGFSFNRAVAFGSLCCVCWRIAFFLTLALSRLRCQLPSPQPIPDSQTYSGSRLTGGVCLRVYDAVFAGVRYSWHRETITIVNNPDHCWEGTLPQEFHMKACSRCAYIQGRHPAVISHRHFHLLNCVVCLRLNGPVQKPS